MPPMGDAKHGNGPETNCPRWQPNCRWYPSILGYWWQKKAIPGLISVESTLEPQPIYTSGVAVFYAPGVMESVSRYRKMPLDDYVDGVALMSCADIGQKVWIKQLEVGEWEGPFLVIDCAARHDYYGVTIFNQEVVEVGFETAVRWGMAKKISKGKGYKSLDSTRFVYVSRVQPEYLSVCPDPVHYPTWWENEVMEFTRSGRNRRASELKEAIAGNNAWMQWLSECVMRGANWPPERRWTPTPITMRGFVQ